MKKTRSNVIFGTVLLLTLPGNAMAQGWGDLKNLDPRKAQDKIKEVAQISLGCGYLGGALGYYFGDEKDARWAAIGGAAACGVIALEMDRRRNAAIKNERELDKQISEQKISNATLEQENAKLRQSIKDLEKKAEQIRAEKDRNPKLAVQLASEIQAEKDAAVERIKILDIRISAIDREIASGSLSDSEKAQLLLGRDKIVERKGMFEQIANISYA